MKGPLLVLLCGLGLSPAWAASAEFTPSTDPAAISRGAVLYMDNCASCHSLKYLRYDRLKDVGFSPAQIKTYQDLTQSAAASPISAQLSADLTKKMFGLVPPDLSLVSKAKSPDWVYQYLQAFYPDSTRPSGFNNHIAPNVAMPDVLAPLHQQVGDQAFAAKVADLVSFLDYTADPSAPARQFYGLLVLIFLAIFLIPLYLLHKEYWKDIP